MHDIRLIRENPEAFDTALARRGGEPCAQKIVALDAERRAVATRLQEGLAQRNKATGEIGQLIALSKIMAADAVSNAVLGKPVKERGLDKLEQANLALLKAKVAELKDSLAHLETQDGALSVRLQAALAEIPNLPAEDVPDGDDEAGNVEVLRWGTPRSFDFAPREHADLGPMLGMDFETGAALSGARFTFLRGAMARLARGLGQFMLDRQTATHGYTECAPPLLVRDEAMFGTGQLPKFEQDLFSTFVTPTAEESDELIIKILRISEDPNLSVEEKKSASLGFVTQIVENPRQRRWLIPTAEVSLTNSVREQILADVELPIRMTALTPCFRSEAGAAGKDTRGFIRQHQFDKVELVSITRPEDSAAEHERMTAAAEDILQALGLPYRKMLLCTGDMGFSAMKTYDLEVWLPGQNAYREISSCSNCGDFQARRMNARYRPQGEKGTRFVHTLNGSGLAVGRTLVAVLENGQQADGSVDLPDALHPYLGGMTRLEPMA